MVLGIYNPSPWQESWCTVEHTPSWMKSILWLTASILYHPRQRWASAMEKLSDSRHRQSTTNTRHSILYNQEPTTSTDSDIRQSCQHSTNRHPTTYIKTTHTDTRQIQVTIKTDARQPIAKQPTSGKNMRKYSWEQVGSNDPSPGPHPINLLIQ